MDTVTELDLIFMAENIHIFPQQSSFENKQIYRVCSASDFDASSSCLCPEGTGCSFVPSVLQDTQYRIFQGGSTPQPQRFSVGGQIVI